jgi:Uma2 family endonuclease
MNVLATLPSPSGSLLPPQDEPLYEVVNGVKVELPPMSIYATRVAGKLYSRLDLHTETNRLGTAVMEALFILDPAKNLRRRPDVAFVSAERWPLDRLLPPTGDWEIVPDLAVEVISPNDLIEDIFDKIWEYFRLGVRQVWIVFPVGQQIYVYDSPTTVRILTCTDELDGGALLPGFRIPVASLFQPQPQAAPAGPSAAP